jgi:plasmid stabilization system protein ParE
MAKRIVFSKRARIDVARITDFNNYRNQSNTYTKKLFTKLTKRLKLLLKHPLTGLKVDGEDGFLLIWDNYYIFYDLDDTSIEVTSIYHQKEDITR